MANLNLPFATLLHTVPLCHNTNTRVPGSLILLVGTHADFMSQAEAKAKIATVRKQVGFRLRLGLN